MKHMFNPSLDLIIEKEGGKRRGYSNISSDPGGETLFGIARKIWPGWSGWRKFDEYRITGRFNPEATENVYELLEKDIKKFYKENFWDAIKANELPAGVDTFLFDCAVNQGCRTAAKILQYAVGATQDGLIGPNTLESVKTKPPLLALDKCLRRRLYYYGIVKNETNRRSSMQGWVHRALDVYSLCIEDV